jgi:hypothetical protein
VEEGERGGGGARRGRRLRPLSFGGIGVGVGRRFGSGVGEKRKEEVVGMRCFPWRVSASRCMHETRLVRVSFIDVRKVRTQDVRTYR